LPGRLARKACPENLETLLSFFSKFDPELGR
jgi:hypothetical protein